MLTYSGDKYLQPGMGLEGTVLRRMRNQELTIFTAAMEVDGRLEVMMIIPFIQIISTPLSCAIRFVLLAMVFKLT
jgi:hypothetical protein